MGPIDSPNLVVGLRFGALLLAALAVRYTLIHGGLLLRLLGAVVFSRTSWPGPFTHFYGRGEMQRAATFPRRPPRLYSRYLLNAGMVVIATVLIISTMVTLVSRVPPKKELTSILAMLVICLLTLFTAARQASRYEAEVEWALGQSPEMPMTTDEAEDDVRAAYITARTAIRRIWTQIWLIALSGLFIFTVFQNGEGGRMQRALAAAEEGRMTRQHPEAVIREKRAFYFRDAGGTVAKLENPRIYLGSTLAVYKTDDGEPCLALLLKKRTVESWQSQKAVPAILYAPLLTLAFPELGPNRPKVLVVIGELADLASFAKGRRALGPIFTVVCIGFSIYALFLIVSLRRLVRVTFARRGRLRA